MFPKIKVHEQRDTMHCAYVMQFDGCSKKNPGIAGAGAVIYKNQHEIWSDSFFVGESATNNHAEYAGLILGLQQAIATDIKELHVEGDSLLVINQMLGKYKCNSPNLYDLYERAKILLQEFDVITFEHILRNRNKRADQLANIAVEKYVDSIRK